MDHEDVDLRPARHRVDRGRSGIARGGADDRQVAVRLAEELLEQQSQQLQRDVLERQRRAVEQLEQPVLLVELHQRGDRLVREAAIGLRGQLEQALGRQAIAHERLHDPLCQFGIGQPGQRGDLGLAEAWPFARHVKPAVGGKPGKRGIGEIERGRAAAGADVVHRRAIAAARARGKVSG